MALWREVAVGKPEDDLDYRSLSLAATFEALAEVHASAHGRDHHSIDHILAPLFTGDAQSLSEVFPRPDLYRSGVETAKGAIAGERRQLPVIKYAFVVMELAAQLKRDAEVAERLGRLLPPLAGARCDASLMLTLDEIYQKTVSSLGKRIQVVGDAASLQQPTTAARIRALLLAAVRFAWLWGQLGGRRWQFLLQRRRLLAGLDGLEAQLA